MGFFEDLGQLMEKYEFEVHAIQLDENVKIMNDRFHLNLSKNDLPPPIIIFRTTEGDFVPQVFGPITIKNEEHNVKFFNVKDNSTVTLFPVVEEKKEELKTEELSQEEAEKVATTLNALGDALQNGMNWEEVPKTETNKEEVKQEEQKVQEKIEEKKEEVKVEETPAKKTVKRNKKNKANVAITNYILIGSIFTESGRLNINEYEKFIETHRDKLQNNFDTLVHVVKDNTNITAEPKLTTKEGKDLIKNLEFHLASFTKIIALESYKDSAVAKKLIKDLKAKGFELIEEDKF